MSLNRKWITAVASSVLWGILASSAALAQPLPVDARFGGLCIAPRDVWFVDVTGVELRVEALLSDVDATFPDEWQGRSKIGVKAALRPPGLVLRFMSPLQLFYNLDKAVQFEPPPPWLAPLDSLTISWDPLRGVESNLLGISWFSNECAFLIETTDKAVVQAEATVNLVGIYAAADTVIVWGTEFGWPDHHLLEERPTWPSPVEDRTWGQLKHMMYPENGANR